MTNVPKPGAGHQGIGWAGGGPINKAAKITRVHLTTAWQIVLDTLNRVSTWNYSATGPGLCGFVPAVEFC